MQVQLLPRDFVTCTSTEQSWNFLPCDNVEDSNCQDCNSYNKYENILATKIKCNLSITGRVWASQPAFGPDLLPFLKLRQPTPKTLRQLPHWLQSYPWMDTCNVLAKVLWYYVVFQNIVRRFCTQGIILKTLGYSKAGNLSKQQSLKPRIYKHTAEK